VKFNVAMVLAVVLAEIVSVMWYSATPWSYRHGHRYIFTAIIADAILVVLVKWIIENFWSIRKWQDAAILSMWLSLVFACLQAPHEVHLSSDSSVAAFLYHVIHKILLMTVMTLSLFYFEKY